MRKVKFKDMKELCEGETEVLKTKVTLVLKGSFCSERVADDADSAVTLNMGSFNAEDGFGSGHFLSSKLSVEEELGTCSACAPSCSPCVQFEPVALVAKKNNGVSGEACKNKDSNGGSFEDADLSSPWVNSTCNDRHHTSSETSHPLSACLSHESYCENAESDETLRDCNTSGGSKMIIKPNLCHTLAISCDSLKASIFHGKAVSNPLEKQKETECLGDNIAFICGSDYVKTRVGGDADKKNMSYVSASVDSFSEIEKAVKAPPVSSYLVCSPSDQVNVNHPRRSNRSANESSQEILCCSTKSDLSEISSLRDSCAGASSAKGERSECSEEQVQSSFARPNALQTGCQIGDEHNSAVSMQADAGVSEREQTAEVKPSTVVKEVNLKETTIGSCAAACSDGSDSGEFEIKVCDICGDIGREELLAVCSKCNDGAEHIYCMRVKMDNVPKGDWMCEECMIGEETVKQKQDKLEKGVRTCEKSNTLEPKTKSLDAEESKAHIVNSTGLFSSKRPAGSSQAVGKKPFGTVLESPSASSSSRKTSLHLSGGLFSRTPSKSLRVPTESTSKSLKLSSQSHILKGSLFKSKSFSVRSSKEDVQLVKEGSCGLRQFGKESAPSDHEGGVRMMSKSMSLQNMRSHGVNNGNGNRDIKLLPNFSHPEDVKRSRHAKEQYPIKTHKKLKLADSDSLASVADKRITYSRKNSLRHSSGSSCHDLSAVKGNDKSDNSLKTSGQSAQGGCVNEEKRRVVNTRRQVEYSADLVHATGTNNSNVNAPRNKEPSPRDSSMFASSADMPSWISSIPQLDYRWRGKFEIQRSGGLTFTSDGIQAHLSTYSSRKVVEVVQKLPRKLLLEEVPRLSMWPTQFMKSHAKEENIALYFFAEDLDSYEKSYENLVDRMLKNDFSLKGNFGGFDLLIFPSNLLPEKSWRWNHLLFLWGVFRGKSVHCSGQIPAMSPENLIPQKSSENKSAFVVSCNTDQSQVTPGRMVEVGETKASSWEEKPLDLQTSCSPQVGGVDGQMKNEQFSKGDSSLREDRELKRRPEIDLNCSLQESEDCNADGVDIGNNDSKRFKSCFTGMDIENGSDKDRNERCSIAINGKGPSISSECKSRAYEMSIASSELDSICTKKRWESMQQQVLSGDSGNRLDSCVSSLELKLGIEKSSSHGGNISPFFTLMGSKESESATGGETNPSLALSLALPYPEKARASKPDLEMKSPKWPEVKTTLSLFGVSLDS